MNVKWMAFAIFLWFIGMIMGSVWNEQFIDDYHVGTVALSESTVNSTVQNTFTYLFDLTKGEKETALGNVLWKLGSPNYYATWFGVMTFNFDFLKDYNSVTGLYDKATIQS